MTDETNVIDEETLRRISGRKVNILITGATGAGKSSTINALFNGEPAKVGTTANPETKTIDSYQLGNLTVWDSPGLGDGQEADNRHAADIQRLLTAKDENGDMLIDAVLVVVNGGSAKLKTTYELINKVIVPCLGNEASKRLVIGINQADVANDGDGWNETMHQPEPELSLYLKKKEQSMQNRIAQETGISVQPVSYSAGYKEEGEPQEPSYNMLKLCDLILSTVPSEKRLPLLGQTNQKMEVWKSNDEEIAKYITHIREQVRQDEDGAKVLKAVESGVAVGGLLGSFIPFVGTGLGALIGGGIGLIGSLFGD